MQKMILSNYKLDSDPKLYETKGTNYYVFFVSSVTPSRNDIYTKFSCQVWGYLANEVERLKLHKGSIVDITADYEVYLKDGNLANYLVVKDISISEVLHGKEKKEVQAKEQTVKDKQRKLVEELENIPFGNRR